VDATTSLRLSESPRNWGIFENFCVKINLQSVSYRKKLGEQDVLVAPPIILVETGEPPAPSVPAPMALFTLIDRKTS